MTMAAAPGDAVRRYQYLLRTADPDQIEEAHEQAFARMSAAERAEVLQALASTSEKPTDASAGALARSATRLEVQEPGALQRLLGTTANGAGLGRSVLASLAAGFVGAAAWGSLTGGDGVGGRPGLLSRLFGLGGRRGGWGEYGGLDNGFYGLGGPARGFGGPGGPGGPGGGGPGGGPGGGGPGGPR